MEAESAPNLSNNRGNGVRQQTNSSGVLRRFIWALSRGFRPGDGVRRGGSLIFSQSLSAIFRPYVEP